MKKFLTAMLSSCIFATAIPFHASAAEPDYSLWDKFLKYDLCITDYDSLTDKEKELCKFIFETEQSANETIICERARRTLAHDENIGERITLEQLEDCYGIWDRYSYSKAGDSWYIHCVPDIKHLDGWDDYNEYWLDDEGTAKVISTGENSGMDTDPFKVQISSEEDLTKFDFSEFDITENHDGTYYFEIERKSPSPFYEYQYIDGAEKLIASEDLLNINGDYYFILPDNTAVFVKSKYSTRMMREETEPITETVVIPEEINGCPVTAIEWGAFQYAPITKVVLPETIRFIEDSAFNGCLYLEDINFPRALEYIGMYTFTCCAFSELDIDCPELRISPWSFTHLDITSAKLNVNLIDDSSFEYCADLKNLVLGDNVEKIGANAFLGCRSIENLQLPKSLKSIGAGAFAGDELCYSGAKSITIPSNVQVIGALPYKRGEGATSGIEVPPICPLTDIQPCAFDSDCTINGFYGTEAHSYALENNLKFNPMDELLYGDANGDNEIGVADAVTLQKYLLKNSEIGYEADLNKDGRIDSFDMIAMRNMLINN